MQYLVYYIYNACINYYKNKWQCTMDVSQKFRKLEPIYFQRFFETHT